jgi:hypothetical protein
MRTAPFDKLRTAPVGVPSPVPFDKLRAHSEPRIVYADLALFAEGSSRVSDSNWLRAISAKDG